MFISILFLSRTADLFQKGVEKLLVSENLLVENLLVSENLLEKIYFFQKIYLFQKVVEKLLAFHSRSNNFPHFNQAL